MQIKWNLEETDKFLQAYNHPRLNHEEREDMNRKITINESETVIRKTIKKQKL